MATVYELAQLSGAAYKTSRGVIAGDVAGWRAVASFGDPTSGFYAVHFVKQANREVVLSVRGTDPSQMSDLGADVQLAVGSVPHQFYPAENSLKQVKTSLGGRTFYLTGHSLGGGLASMLSAKHRLPVVTFNAPGMKTSYTSLVGGVSPMTLASTSMGMSPYGGAGVPVYDPFMHQQLDELHKAERNVSAVDTSKMLNIRASGDVVSVGTGPAIGRVESILVKDGSLNGWQKAAGIAVPVVGLVQAGNYALQQHSIENMVKALSALPKYKTELHWATAAVPPPAPPVPPPSASALRIQRVHTVVHGETLSKIAQRYYGDAQKWPVIYALPSNKALIGANPSMIRMGMRLTIP